MSGIVGPTVDFDIRVSENTISYSIGYFGYGISATGIIDRTVEMYDGMVLADYDADGLLLGFEFLRAGSYSIPTTISRIMEPRA